MACTSGAVRRRIHPLALISAAGLQNMIEWPGLNFAGGDMSPSTTFRSGFLAGAALCSLIALALCVTNAQNKPSQEPKSAVHGIVIANMDTSMKPGDDFYQYTNGGWLARTEIPPDRGSSTVAGI